MSDIIIMKFPPFFNKKQIDSINTIKPDILLFDNDFIAELKEFIFPNSIFYVIFGNNFNKSLKYVILPKYLKKLKLGNNYTQSLDYVYLPDSIEIIDFGTSFNNSLFSVRLPKNLKELILNDIFNASLPSVLPDNLEKIILGKEFDFSINNFIVPQHLKYICINGKVGNKVLFKTLPKTLQHIEVVKQLNFRFYCSFPNLETLILHTNSKEILINTKKCNKLKYVKCCGSKLNTKFLSNLPNSVTKLEIIGSLCTDLINLPDGLEELFINIPPTVNENFLFNLNNPNNFIHNPPIHPVPLEPDYPVYFVLQTNLPITLKTLKLYDEKLLKFFDKIPYDCDVVDINNMAINTDNYKN